MRNILYGVLLTSITLFIFKYYVERKEEKIFLKESSNLIQDQIRNVGKLVVTEGHFSEVFTYKNSKDIFGELFTADKKALVVVNANVSIAYDLSKIKYNIDVDNKTLTIKYLPLEEVKIQSDLEYYDVQDDYLNPFIAKDYNAINKTVKGVLAKKIENSDLKINAKNRLLTELSKFYVLTNSLGWTLKYNDTEILSTNNLESLKL